MNYTDPIAKLFGSWASDLTVWSIILRATLSVLLAFAIGSERSTKGHSARLKTFVLLSFSATVCRLLDCAFWAGEKSFPICSAAAVIATALISGNAVLFGAKNQVKGLTTSAWLWSCSVVGLILGGGMYTAAIALSVLLVIILAAMPKIEAALKNRSRHFEIHLELQNKYELPNFINTLRKLGMHVDEVEINSAYINSGLSVYALRLTIESEELRNHKNHKEIIKALQSIDYVNYVEEIV